MSKPKPADQIAGFADIEPFDSFREVQHFISTAKKCTREIGDRNVPVLFAVCPKLDVDFKTGEYAAAHDVLAGNLSPWREFAMALSYQLLTAPNMENAGQHVARMCRFNPGFLAAFMNELESMGVLGSEPGSTELGEDGAEDGPTKNVH